MLDKCLTRFRFPWKWDGGPAMIASRAVDSTGYVQPTVADIQKARAIVGFVQHHNGIQPWSVSAERGGEKCDRAKPAVGRRGRRRGCRLRTDAPATSTKPARPDVALGKPIAEADIAPWNIDIRTPDGLGLPPGSGTVAAGKALYDAKCAACHGADAKGGPVYGTMVGGIGSFTTNARVLTPGSMYPYAPILFDYIRRAMPMDRPHDADAERGVRARRPTC